MPDILTWFRALIEWFKSPWKVLIVLAVMCGLLLFLPSCWLSMIGLEEWAEGHRVLEWGIFGFCVLMLAVNGLEAVGKRLRMKSRLKNLAADEQELLRPFVGGNLSTHHCVTYQAAMSSLEASGILTVAQPSTDITKDGGIFYFRIQPWMLRYLRQHPEHVGLPKK